MRASAPYFGSREERARDEARAPREIDAPIGRARRGGGAARGDGAIARYTDYRVSRKPAVADEAEAEEVAPAVQRADDQQADVYEE